MSFFRNISNKFFGDPPPIRPIKDVLPKSNLTDVEVCYYLIEGADLAQRLTATWLHDVKFIGFLYTEIKKYRDLKEDLYFAYEDAFLETCIQIKTGVYQAKSSLNTYFYTIFHHKVVNVFREKGTNKRKAEKEFYENREAAIEEKCRDTPVAAVEPNEIAELLTLFEQKEPNQTHWIRLDASGWKDVDFVETGMAKTAGSARSYLAQCKNAFEQFLIDNNHPYDRRKGSKLLKKNIKTLILITLYAFNALF